MWRKPKANIQVIAIMHDHNPEVLDGQVGKFSVGNPKVINLIRLDRLFSAFD